MAQKINNPITLCGCNAFPQLRNSFSQKEKYGSVHVMILRSARTSSKEYLRFLNPSATKKIILQCYLSSFFQGERLTNCQNIRKPDPQMLGKNPYAIQCTMCTLRSKITLYQIQSHNLECKIRFFR